MFWNALQASITKRSPSPWSAAPRPGRPRPSIFVRADLADRVDAHREAHAPPRRRPAPSPRPRSDSLDQAAPAAGRRDRPRCPRAKRAASVAEVHDGVLGLAAVGQEAALGQPPVERHLAALEPRAHCRRPSGPSGPCGPLPEVLPWPEPGPRPTRLRLASMARRRPQILKPHALTLSTCGTSGDHRRGSRRCRRGSPCCRMRRSPERLHGRLLLRG